MQIMHQSREDALDALRKQHEQEKNILQQTHEYEKVQWSQTLVAFQDQARRALGQLTGERDTAVQRAEAAERLLLEMRQGQSPQAGDVNDGLIPPAHT